MSDLFTPIAQSWAQNAVKRHSKSIFGKLVPAVIWVDARDDDGEHLVPFDPIRHVAEINKNPWILLNGHDPGKPVGQMLECANFESEDGRRFIAAILGYYAGGEVLNFQEFGFDKETLRPSPKNLPVLPDECWIGFETDPREVDAAWLELVTNDSPIPIKHIELSHNSADFIQELIKINLPYLLLVWNPLITSIASEAGKDIYAAIRGWVKKLLSSLADLREPILEIKTYQDNCQVSFLFRGKDVRQHYAAHDAQPNAAAQAAQLISKLKARRMAARQLSYEFDKEALKWFPSYAILNDNRIITSSIDLIAIEQLPTQISLGLTCK